MWRMEKRKKNRDNGLQLQTPREKVVLCARESRAGADVVLEHSGVFTVLSSFPPRGGHPSVSEGTLVMRPRP